MALAGDGQVSLDDTIIKGKARKIRRLHNDRILAGFAGSTADALSLFRVSRANSKNSMEICPERPWSLPKSGVPTKCCVTCRRS